MTMSEFETLLARIDGVGARVEELALSLATHCAAEDASKAVTANIRTVKSKWMDRVWTLTVCVLGGILGFVLRK
jgi:hypothetical protein